ncbi:MULTISPECIES: glycosyltransferase family 4 protein [Streptomyces]|uniref:glycosyltransferase family 4 protein n=1 Tax=Streptomyces TaxID=1883 RepID=UPI000F7ACB25|nr:glycosyltransferase family 4 protein [Streptomyces sp. WAC05858]RSS45455.1 glycosyltransferase [Streptomyces sp. WAC05858]
MLHAYPPTHNAGAEWAAHSLLRELAARGHAVDVLLSVAAAVDEGYELDGVLVHPFRGKADPGQWMRGDSRADVIVAHLENTARASILGEMNRIPVVHLLHNTYDKSKQWLVKGAPQLVVYNTEWMRGDVEVWWRINRGDRPMPHGIVVHPPVAVDDYQAKPGDRITLINLTEEKGAKVFYALAERMPRRKFLGVVGGYGHQIVRDDLSNVEIVPHTPGDRMGKDVYARTKLLLTPSMYESYGRVAVEAMCSGIPVIAHPTPGLRESLGRAGTFCDRDDIDAWAGEIKRLTAPKEYPRASKAAAARAVELNPKAELDAWCQAIEGVAARGRSR